MNPGQTAAVDRAVEQQWHRLLDALRAAGTGVMSGPRVQDALSQGQSLRYMQRVLRGMFLTAIEQDDAAYPVFVRLFDTYLPYGNANPDCTYFHATVSPQYTYRITGRRGTAQTRRSPDHGRPLRRRTRAQGTGDPARRASRCRRQSRHRAECDPATRKLGAARPRRALAVRASVLLRLGERSPGGSGGRARRRRLSPAPADARGHRAEGGPAHQLDSHVVPASRAPHRDLLRRARRPLPLHVVLRRHGRPALRQGPFQHRARSGRDSRVPPALLPILVHPGDEQFLGEPGVRRPPDLAECAPGASRSGRGVSWGDLGIRSGGTELAGSRRPPSRADMRRACSTRARRRRSHCAWSARTRSRARCTPQRR